MDVKEKPFSGENETFLDRRVLAYVWGILVFLTTIQLFFKSGTTGMVSFLAIFVFQALTWSAWLVFTPLILHLCHRWPLSREKGRKSLWLHACTSVGLVAFFLLYAASLFAVTEAAAFTLPLLGTTWLWLAAKMFQWLVLLYWGIVLAMHALTYQRHYRAGLLFTERLQAQLTAAELDVLKGQLQPHFLFNTLNGISVQIRKKRNVEAESMVADLSGLLRYVLQEQETTVPFEVELGFVRRYLALQKTRYSSRLHITEDIDDSCLSHPFPPLLLQPLVENAIIHGIDLLPEGGRLCIACRLEGAHLRVRLANDGTRETTFSKEGVGLHHCRTRLATLYQERASLDFSAGENGGAVVVLRLPREVTMGVD